MKRRDFVQSMMLGGAALPLLGSAQNPTPTPAPTPAPAAPATLAPGTPPVVTAPGPDRMTVLWAVSGYARGWVEYGETDQLGQRADGEAGPGFIARGDRVLRVKLSGLRPGTRYHAQAVTVPMRWGGGYKHDAEQRSPVFTFTTPDPEAKQADLAIWNGSTWSYVNVFPGMAPRTHALHVHNGVLHAAGEASGFAGTDDVVKRLVNGYWEQVGSPFDATVMALATHNGQLVAGGAFTTLEAPIEPVLMHCATIGSSDWQNLAVGLDAPVRALLSANDTLYAAGDLWANIVPTYGLARLAPGATTWEELLPTHDLYMPAGLGPTYISSLAHHDNTLYFGGTFTIYQMMTDGNHIGRFHGTPDAVEPMAWLEAPVHALATLGNALVMGGDFAMVHAHVAITDLSVGLPDDDRPMPGLFPVPADASVDVTLPAPVDAGAVLRITDGAGRVVKDHAAAAGDRQRIDVHDLAPGAYWLSVGTDGRWRPAPFTKR